MKSRIALFTVLITAVSLISIIVSAQRKPADDKPITGDFKITIRTTVAGHSSESTTMIKGSRERAEMNMGGSGFSTKTVNITQCDMRRTIQINDSARKYLITPMDSDSSSNGDDTSTVGAPPSAVSRRGGVVTLTTNTVDTGERRDMFGFTARHLKRTTMMQSSADACNATQMKIETDGWYINLEYGLSCPANRPPQTGRPSAPGGCHDRYVFKNTGPTNLGYPLQQTTTMYGADGAAMYTTTTEVIELSRQSLDAALFDVPVGYTQVQSQQEMYATPSMAEMMEMAKRQQRQPESTSQAPAATNRNTNERIRVGVVEFNNKTKTSVESDSLRDQLVAALSSKGIDAIALNASSPSEAVTEAQAKQCAYILYTDIATLKTPSTGKKIGGLFGRATGVGSGDAGKAEVKLDFRLVKTGSSTPITQASASEKQETQEAAMTSAILGEAQSVADALPTP